MLLGERYYMGQGPLAQLVERSHGMREVSGSIPLRSTRQYKRFTLPVGRSVVGEMFCNSTLCCFVCVQF